jgi:hypothetical protein
LVAADQPRGISHVTLWAYLLIAFAVLPVIHPLAVVALSRRGAEGR